MISFPGTLPFAVGVGDDVIHPYKICGGCQICIQRPVHGPLESFNVVPNNLASNLYYRTRKKCRLVVWDKEIFLSGKSIFILTCPMVKGPGKSSAN